MTREMWRERWLDSINELTSLDLQIKSWLDKGNTNPHGSFAEFMCTYFDDLSLRDNYQSALNNGWVTDQEFVIVGAWHEALDEYNSPNDDDQDSETILNDQKWLAIVNIGQAVKEKLKNMLTADEIRNLTAEKNVVRR
ncbi:MAG: hypothetical protein HYZ44_16445 [Bacteroidetes bacterium]|nr:hypothetical protein [Bacteroidota bacterium]